MNSADMSTNLANITDNFFRQLQHSHRVFDNTEFELNASETGQTVEVDLLDSTIVTEYAENFFLGLLLRIHRIFDNTTSDDDGSDSEQLTDETDRFLPRLVTRLFFSSLICSARYEATASIRSDDVCCIRKSALPGKI